MTQNSLFGKGHVGDTIVMENSIDFGKVLGSSVCVVSVYVFDLGSGSSTCEWYQILLIGSFHIGSTFDLDSCNGNAHRVLHGNRAKAEWMTSSMRARLPELIHTDCEGLQLCQREFAHGAFEEDISSDTDRCIDSEQLNLEYMVCNFRSNRIRSLREECVKAIYGYIVVETVEPGVQRVIFCIMRRLMSRCTNRISEKRIRMIRTVPGLEERHRIETCPGYTLRFRIRRDDLWLPTAS